MYKPIREVPLTNGLTVRFFDATRRYFGDYHKVRVKISCEVPVTPNLFDDAASYETALKQLGKSVQYVKEVEQQGVPTADTTQAMEAIVRHFMAHSLGYFQSEAFPRKFVQSESKRVTGKAKRFMSIRMHG